MYTEPTLTKEEFRNLHNGLCYLYGIQRKLSEFLNPSLMLEFDKAMETMENGMRRIREEDIKVEDALRNYYLDVQEKQGFKAQWSVYKVGVGKMDQVAFEGEGFVQYAEYWGSKVVDPVPVTNPTWLDLWRAAEKLIDQSGDTHHIFIEDFHQDGKILTLITGS